MEDQAPVRRSARNQSLPRDEVALLNRLKGDDLYYRCHFLYEAGWTYRAIGEAFWPELSRATIHGWVNRTAWAPTLAIHDLPPIPEPDPLTPTEYVRKTTPSPGISPADLQQIQELAPIARKYRARISPLHPAAKANDALTELCKRLRKENVHIQELADAAGVTYRAMVKRLNK